MMLNIEPARRTRGRFIHVVKDDMQMVGVTEEDARRRMR